MTPTPNENCHASPYDAVTREASGRLSIPHDVFFVTENTEPLNPFYFSSVDSVSGLRLGSVAHPKNTEMQYTTPSNHLPRSAALREPRSFQTIDNREPLIRRQFPLRLSVFAVAHEIVPPFSG